MKRRNFIKSIALASVVGSNFLGLNQKLLAQSKEYEISDASVKIFYKLINRAKKENWKKMNINDLNIQIAHEFLNSQYIGGTLEGKGAEICRADFTGLDCVTFVENSLALSRSIKKEKYSVADFFEELIFIRYRNGNITDYASRLHYTSDWISDNLKKGVFKDITKDIGGTIHKFNLNFMSSNPKFYKALEQDTTLIPKIAEIEKAINEQTFYFIEKKSIKKIEYLINNGDIICFTTNKEGLDFAHLGLAYVEKNKAPRLFHASSKQKKVVIDSSISEYINTVSSDTGIVVVRANSI
ncbi:MAG TPA: DUF1460 domain-containing protein [Candidatus Kapabacteria bacterium]|nr:DUF1460 domain-containing protein [Candidatus Kapabacteria bacterium]HPO62343.1 DUF1460 domain-containing protein [Candidatus Kapabacteria bacterium]